MEFISFETEIAIDFLAQTVLPPLIKMRWRMRSCVQNLHSMCAASMVMQLFSCVYSWCSCSCDLHFRFDKTFLFCSITSSQSFLSLSLSLSLHFLFFLVFFFRTVVFLLLYMWKWPFLLLNIDTGDEFSSEDDVAQQTGNWDDV